MGFLQKIFYWEQRKLGDYGSVKMNKRIFKNQTSPNGDIPFYKIGTFGKKADSFISKKLYEKYKVKYPYPKIGDLLISASGSIGRIIEYKGKKAYFQDSNIVWLSHNSKLLNIYLKQYYQRINWNNIEGTTIKRLYNKDILTTHISVPNIKEQKRIGNLLNLVDNLLVLQKRKYKELKLLKKALLQNILTFNSVYPNLRFKNFNSKWRKNKLGELCIYKNGTGHEGKQSSKGKFELVNLNSISIGGGLKSSGKYINSAKNTLNKNDIVMILSDIAHGNLLGKVALIPINNKYVLNQRIALLRIRRNNILPNFLFYRINSLQRYFKIKGNGTSQLNISKSDIINFEISYPNKIKEQFKISSVLKINQKFVNEIYKKEKNLKKIKQFLLQNMFI